MMLLETKKVARNTRKCQKSCRATCGKPYPALNFPAESCNGRVRFLGRALHKQALTCRQHAAYVITDA